MAQINRLVGIMPREGHDDVDEEADAVLVAALDEGSQILVGRGPGGTIGLAELEVRCEEIGGVVAPCAFDEAVGRRQQLKRGHTKLGQVRPANLDDGQIGEIRTRRLMEDQAKDVLERADADFHAAANV